MIFFGAFSPGQIFLEILAIRPVDVMYGYANNEQNSWYFRAQGDVSDIIYCP